MNTNNTLVWVILLADGIHCYCHHHHHQQRQQNHHHYIVYVDDDVVVFVYICTFEARRTIKCAVVIEGFPPVLYPIYLPLPEKKANSKEKLYMRLLSWCARGMSGGGAEVKITFYLRLYWKSVLVLLIFFCLSLWMRIKEAFFSFRVCVSAQWEAHMNSHIIHTYSLLKMPLSGLYNVCLCGTWCKHNCAQWLHIWLLA